MKLLKTTEAVGQMLCHDVTQIIPGVSKGPAFRKGHIITPEDIPVLLNLGKDNIYIWELNENTLHEDEAAKTLYELCRNKYIHHGNVKEGKIDAFSDIDGLLKVDKQALDLVNSQGEIIISTRHNNSPVKSGDILAGMRIIPLVIEKAKLEKVTRAVKGSPILRILPFTLKRVAIITTGNEVFYNRIEDKFTPVVREKIREYGGEILAERISSDDPAMTLGLINEVLKMGADMVLCTGGMSVDPDDRTPYAIKMAADSVVTYGAPVLPGAMFMLAYKDCVPIVGLPGCVMYSRRTIFDLMLPRLMARDKISRNEINILGEGGLCLNCNICTFPNCGFGR